MGGKDHGRRNRGNKSLLQPKPSEKSVYRTAFEAAEKKGPTDDVASLLWQGHNRGDGRATYALATWYIHGTLFQTNPRKGIGLLRIARKKGIREAIFDLAYSYEIGFGVTKSLAKAFDLYVEAAQKGDHQALSEVVRCVYYGVGTSKHKELGFLIRSLSNGS